MGSSAGCDRWQTLFIAAFAGFALAAATGALFRWGAMSGFPQPLTASNVRHAHSHLMLMGWATPALMALVAGELRTFAGRELGRGALASAWASLLLSVASYPAYLRWGYDPVSIGSATLPLAAVISGLAMLGWYGFVVGYVRASWGAQRGVALSLWDTAMAYLVVSSFGAWSLAFLMINGAPVPFLAQTSLHLFVDLFAEGWLLLATLALLAARCDVRRVRLGPAMLALIVSLPPVFFLAVDVDLVPLRLRMLAHIAMGVAGVGLLALVLQLVRAGAYDAGRVRVRVMLAALGLKALVMLVASVPSLLELAVGARLRVLYLHLLFLGAVTPTMYLVAAERWGRQRWRSEGSLVAVCAVLLASLLPLTGLWPSAGFGMWAFRAALIAAVVPTLFAMGVLLRLPFDRHR